MPIIQQFEITFESTAKGTQLRKASEIVRTPAVGASAEGEVEDWHDASWSLLAIRHRGEGRGLAPKAADERTHRHGQQVFRGIWRDERHGKPMGTMSVDDVDSAKLIKTSEVENKNTAFRMEQLRDTYSAGSVIFETNCKDHGLKDGTKARLSIRMQVLRSSGRKIYAKAAVRVFHEDVMTPTKNPLLSPRKAVQFGRAHKKLSTTSETSHSARHPSASSVSRSAKNELGQRCVSINAAAGNRPGGDGAGGGF